MGTRLILVRHGETPASVERRFAGSTDVELTQDGRDQALEVGRRLRDIRIDALYASPMKRCVQTAAAIAQTTGLKVRDAPELRECDFGAWENMTITEVMSHDHETFQAWVADDSVAPPSGESWGDVSVRTWGWWERASTKHDDRTICAVTHGGPILCMLRKALDAPYRSLFVVDIAVCSITLFQVSRGILRVPLVNDTSHLSEALRQTGRGLPA